MTEHVTDAGGPMAESTRRRLGELRRALLRLHKVLLDAERASYERAHGRVESSGELLQLVIHDEWFAWLHPVSELVVRIDELFDADEPATGRDALDILAQARALLTPSEGDSAFGGKYFAALQREPAVVLAHAAVARLLSAGESDGGPVPS